LSEVVAWSDIQEALDNLKDVAVNTPLLRNSALDEVCGRQVFLKAETFQRTGSFKFRGAFHRISQISLAERDAGVIAGSSGNHALGVAEAARCLGVRARIVMPDDAPAVKLAATRALGAEVIPYDRYAENRDELTARLRERDGGTIVHPFDDPYVIAGQGTAGAELFQQVASLGQSLDALLVCAGGGGLVAGIALAAEQLSPGTEIYTVEPEGFDDYRRSLLSGRREISDTTRRSICDALLTPQPGALTFPINCRLLTGGLAVSEADVCSAMLYAFRVLKLVVEPGGVVALAALLAGKLAPHYRRVGVILSGANVDPAFFARVLRESG